jgi:hypothetical protein
LLLGFGNGDPWQIVEVVAFQMGHVPLHFVLLPLAVLSEIHDIQVTSVITNNQ